MNGRLRGACAIDVTLDTIPSVVSISNPEDGVVVATESVSVSGTLDDSATVSVNGISATIGNGTFTADAVPLTEGPNTITATATDPAGNVGEDAIEVIRDTTAPVVVIVSPLDGVTVSSSPITVSGAVDDDTATVTVNGVGATVVNGTFTANGGLLGGVMVTVCRPCSVAGRGAHGLVGTPR